MIFAIRNGMLENLTAKGFPVSVACGTERPHAIQRHHVVIDFDDTIGDAFGPAPGGDADQILACRVGYAIRIYASAPNAGALAWEHRIEVGKLRDGVIVALVDWASEQHAGNVEIVSGRMMTAEELEAIDDPLIAGYALSVRIGRSVNRKRYDGSGQPTATLAGTTTTTRVTLDGATYEEID